MTTAPADRVIAGRYALRRRRGGGGMGTVWHAEDQVLHRPVAVKEVSLPASLDDHELPAVRTEDERTHGQAEAAEDGQAPRPPSERPDLRDY